MYDLMILNHFRFNWTAGILVVHVIWFYYYYDHEVATIKTIKQMDLSAYKCLSEGPDPKSLYLSISLSLSLSDYCLNVWKIFHLRLNKINILSNDYNKNLTKEYKMFQESIRKFFYHCDQLLVTPGLNFSQLLLCLRSEILDIKLST